MAVLSTKGEGVGSAAFAAGALGFVDEGAGVLDAPGIAGFTVTGAGVFDTAGAAGFTVTGVGVFDAPGTAGFTVTGAGVLVSPGSAGLADTGVGVLAGIAMFAEPGTAGEWGVVALDAGAGVERAGEDRTTGTGNSGTGVGVAAGPDAVLPVGLPKSFALSGMTFGVVSSGSLTAGRGAVARSSLSISDRKFASIRGRSSLSISGRRLSSMRGRSSL